MSEWLVKNLLMAIIVGLFVSWWRNTGRAYFGRIFTGLRPHIYFIHSSPSYGRMAGSEEEITNEEKSYGRWKRMDDAGETAILFIFAAFWTSEASNGVRDFLSVELLAIAALVALVGWFRWVRNTPPAPSAEGDTE